MKKSLMIILIVLMTIVIVIGTTIIVSIYRPPQKNVEAAVEEDESIIVISTGEPFVTNVKESRSILKCNIFIEVKGEETETIVKNSIARVRDRIINILRNLSDDDIKKQDIQDILKNNIIQSLQNDLEIDNITNIYFHEFIIQR